ncbi:WYL domain-containing protein [Limibacter armeniacum]|uniref:WYL domain-containing protein n=1 Tax=Limibacter armeniacum TaxID=466084 RepID=UPI002FE53FE9
MPVNRNALIRYKTIDKCLQNRYRKWTLEDLIDACSEALYEYEGIDKGISTRTIQADIQMMRSDKLGYNAPIIVESRKYYTYEDPNYSIINTPISEQDLGRLSEAVEMMKQFQGFSHFRELEGMVQKLEDHIHAQKTDSKKVIDFEKNDNLKGLDWLDPLYKAIINQKAIAITYKSFKAQQENTFTFHPYLLKEFRNRWFVIGSKNQEKTIMNLALDRIQKMEISQADFRENPDFDPETYFKDAIGVSVSSNVETIRVILAVSNLHAPYIMTKPLHSSQKQIGKDRFGIIISLDVQHNFELEKEILSFGDGINVMAPEKLKRRIIRRLNNAVNWYQTDLKDKAMNSAKRKLEHKGFSILPTVYTKQEIEKIGMVLAKGLPSDKTYAQRQLLMTIPELKPLLLNRNLTKLIETISPNAFLIKSIYFDKVPEANWYVSWHQDIPINVKEKIEVEGFSKWTFKENVISVCPPEDILKRIFTIRIHLDDTDEANGALNVIPSSHNMIHTPESIQEITDDRPTICCEVPAGGVQLMKPLTLHASSKSRSQKRRRVIHLEFTDIQLPKGMEWSENLTLS